MLNSGFIFESVRPFPFQFILLSNLLSLGRNFKYAIRKCFGKRQKLHFLMFVNSFYERCLRADGLQCEHLFHFVLYNFFFFFTEDAE